MRARDDAGRPVALKLVLGQRDTSTKRFAREVAALAGLAHDNVVRYLGSGDEPLPWLAMELVEGEDLKTRLERERQLAPPAAALLMEGVARGVAHAHARGIVHRDLKPSNVLVRPGGQAVVTDFGLARGLDASRFTQTGAMLGTLATMAPEQVRGERVGPPADVWALGVMLFGCLTGRSPFHDDSAIALTTAIVHQEIPSPRSLEPRVPLDLDATCRACLQRDPALRPTAAAVASALRMRRPPAGAPRGGGARRRRAAVVGAALALAIVGAVTLLTHASPPDAAGPATVGPATPDLEPARGPAPTWSLGAAPAPDVDAPSLWDDPGRIAAPLAAVLDGRPGARQAAMTGVVRSADQGRLATRYDPRGLRPAPVNPPFYVQAADAPHPFLGPTPGAAEGAAVIAANDSSVTDAQVGSARWAAAGLSLRWRREALVDGDDLWVRLGVGGDEPYRSLHLMGRGGRLAHEGASVPMRSSDAWRTLRFAPGAPPGARVVLDDEVVPTLDAAAAAPAPPGQVRLRLSEAHLGFLDLEVEGALLRPDRPALAWAPARLGPRARVTATFEGNEGGHGGPLVVLAAGEGEAAIVLELDGRALRLVRDGRTIARADVGQAAAGELRLERLEDDRLRGALVGAGAGAIVEAVDPLPWAAAGLQPAGARPRRAWPSRASVERGPDDPARAARLDAAAAAGSAVEHLARGGRRGHALAPRRAALARVTDPDCLDPPRSAPRPRRRVTASQPGPWQLRRRRPGHRRRAPRCWPGRSSPPSWRATLRARRPRPSAPMRALGLDRVRARVGALEHEGERPALVGHLTVGYYSMCDAEPHEAALTPPEVLAPTAAARSSPGAARRSARAGTTRALRPAARRSRAPSRCSSAPARPARRRRRSTPPRPTCSWTSVASTRRSPPGSGRWSTRATTGGRGSGAACASRGSAGKPRPWSRSSAPCRSPRRGPTCRRPSWRSPAARRPGSPRPRSWPWPMRAASRRAGRLAGGPRARASGRGRPRPRWRPSPAGSWPVPARRRRPRARGRRPSTAAAQATRPPPATSCRPPRAATRSCGTSPGSTRPWPPSSTDRAHRLICERSEQIERWRHPRAEAA
ncbi:MAG: protein kinase [Planctomycetes bacterium]|nr:protein kinase [Planctomycetota bacterium]